MADRWPGRRGVAVAEGKRVPALRCASVGMTEPLSSWLEKRVPLLRLRYVSTSVGMTGFEAGWLTKRVRAWRLRCAPTPVGVPGGRGIGALRAEVAGSSLHSE